MGVTSFKKKIFVLRKNGSVDGLNYLKEKFSRVDYLTSSINWNIRYTLYKPSKPTKEELEWLKREVNNLETLIKKVKDLPFSNKSTIEIIEKKLKYIKEEFENYPFSNRKEFFLYRIKFLNSILQKELKIENKL